MFAVVVIVVVVAIPSSVPTSDVPFVQLHNSRFNFHCYTQCEERLTQKSYYDFLHENHFHLTLKTKTKQTTTKNKQTNKKTKKMNT